jgi:hypothetical protein
VFSDVIDVITAIGALATAVAVVVGVIQLRVANSELTLSKEVNQAQFEDGLTREYRAVVQRLPVAAFFTGEMVDLDDPDTLRAFYAYFDLSNKQLWLVLNDRINEETATHWKGGIEANLELRSFAAAWAKISELVSEDSFGTLRKFAPPAT